jgi:double-stranded uracil-DNA glycosylase
LGVSDAAPPKRRFTRSELERFVGAPVTPLVEPGVRLLFVGINPGLWTAAVDAHFARRGNRFWPALHAAGITPHAIDASNGLRADDRALLVERGVGITNVVNRATARADELSRDEVVAGGVALRRFVDEVTPALVAILGVTVARQAYAAVVGSSIVEGPMDVDWGGARWWVLPNPSGLNAHETVDSLAGKYRAAAVAAGIALA